MADTAPMPSPMLLLFIALIVAANASTTWAIHAARKNGWTKPQIRWYVAAFAAADLIGMVGVLATVHGIVHTSSLAGQDNSGTLAGQ